MVNNSHIAIEKVVLTLEDAPDNTEALQESQAKLAKIIEAIEAIENSREWSTLKELIFSGAVESLEKRLRHESEKATLNDAEIYRLQGQLLWARKYADLTKLKEGFRVELANIKKLTRPL